MNSEEQTLIDGLFAKLKQAETDSAPRDPQAEARIKEHLGQQPGAPYYMAQAILVQEVAIKQLEAQSRQRDEQIQQLQAELQRTKTQAAAPAPAQSGGFLSSIFGGGTREPQAQQPSSFSQQRPSTPQPSAGGWRDSGPASPPPYNGAAPQGNYQQPPQQQAPAAPMGSGFLGGALKTAAGVAGGVMLAEGISSLFHHNSQPQEIVEIIKEEPAQNVSDTSSQDTGSTGGWNDDQQTVTSNDSWGNNNDGGGFADTDYGNDDGGGMFDDDDSFV